MRINIEVKNSGGQLLLKETNKIKQLWKTRYTLKGLERTAIIIKEEGSRDSNVLVAHVDTKKVLDLYQRLVEALRYEIDLINISYTDLYRHIPDEEAFKIIESLGYDKVKYLSFAKTVAKQRCDVRGMKFQYAVLKDEDKDKEAYKHGWGLIMPIPLVEKGLNPHQFYKYICDT